MSKIVVVGSEEFGLGFELVGVERYDVEKIEEVMHKDSDIGIAIISKDDYEELSMKIKNQIDKSLKPIVVILSEEDIKGGNLRELVVRALGVDVMK